MRIMNKLFAFDLDGTLLNSDKVISEKTHLALEVAYEAGVVLVPCTGRLLLTVPDFLRELPIIRYMILGNGGVIYDKEENKVLFKAEIPMKEALEIFELIKPHKEVLYDCYTCNRAYTEEYFYNNIDDYTTDSFSKDIFIRLRIPLKDFFGTIKSFDSDIQKISVYSKNHDEIRAIKEEIEAKYDNLVVTKSLKDNSEINIKTATKGQAIYRLADILGIPRSETIAIGDGTNDLDMIMMAGIGVAMANAMEPVLEAADVITESNDEDGVAKFLFRMLGIIQ